MDARASNGQNDDGTAVINKRLLNTGESEQYGIGELQEPRRINVSNGTRSSRIDTARKDGDGKGSAIKCAVITYGNPVEGGRESRRSSGVPVRWRREADRTRKSAPSRSVSPLYVAE